MSCKLIVSILEYTGILFLYYCTNPATVAPPQPEPSYGVCQRLYESAQKQRENCGRALTTLCEIFGADHPTEEHECFAEKARDDIFDIIVNSASGE